MQAVSLKTHYIPCEEKMSGYLMQNFTNLTQGFVNHLTKRRRKLGVNHQDIKEYILSNALQKKSEVIPMYGRNYAEIRYNIISWMEYLKEGCLQEGRSDGVFAHIMAFFSIILLVLFQL